MILENIHCLLQFDDRGNLLALVSKSSGRNYIVKDGCSLFRLTMTEIIENRVMPGTLALTGDMAEQTLYSKVSVWRLIIEIWTVCQ